MFDINSAGFKQAADLGILDAPGVDQSLGIVAINTLPLFVARRRCALRAVLRPESAVCLAADIVASVRIVEKLNTVALSKILKGRASMEKQTGVLFSFFGSIWMILPRSEVIFNGDNHPRLSP